jgi:hypothetical protein
MTLHDFFLATYGWAALHAPEIFFGAVVVPLVGTILGRIGKAGRTDADGRWIASLVVAAGFLAVILEVIAVVIGVGILDNSLLDASAILLAAPLVCLAGCLLGVRLVFPLSELGSVRTVADLATFALGSAAVVWFFSQFRGWGILFVGSFLQLVVVGVLAFLLMRRLFRRALGIDPTTAKE